MLVHLTLRRHFGCESPEKEPKLLGQIIIKVSFSMFKLFTPDFEAILLSVPELPPVLAMSKKWPQFLRVIL